MNKKSLKKVMIAALSAGILFTIPISENIVSAQRATETVNFVASNLNEQGIYNLKFDKSIGKEYAKNCNG